MCLAKAYLKKGDGDEMLLKNVASMEISEKTITFTTVLLESKTVEATIKSIDFLKGNILLEKSDR
jgi:predicted RNA-binding protein